MKAASTSNESGVARQRRRFLFPGLFLVAVAAGGYWLFRPQQVAIGPAPANVEDRVEAESVSVAAPGRVPIAPAVAGPAQGKGELIGSWRNVQRIDAKQRVLTWETEIAFEANGQYRTKQVINGSTTIRHTGTWRREGDRVIYHRTDCKWEGSDLGREACPNVPTPPTKIVVQGDALELNVEKPDAPVHKFQRVVS